MEREGTTIRILVSNDDGIHAAGIRHLVEAVKHLGDVCVVAPNTQRSASSHGISLHHRIYAETVQWPGVTAYSLTGTPVDCVKWAIVTQCDNGPFDFMLSGINEGANLATDVLYSGTVAAAGEAALQGVPAVALSLCGPDFPFEQAAVAACRLVTKLMTHKWPSDTFLNVNFPNSRGSDAPWTVTELGARSYRDMFSKKTDDNGREYFRYGGEVLGETLEESDVAAVNRGEISITPLRYRFTNNDMIASLKSWLQP